MTRSWTSGSYEISCTARANEYKVKSPAICSSTTLRSAQQKVLSITSRNGKRRHIVARALPSEAISWAQRLRRRHPRPPPKMSRRNDLAPVAAMALGAQDDSTVSPALAAYRLALDHFMENA